MKKPITLSVGMYISHPSIGSGQVVKIEGNEATIVTTKVDVIATDSTIHKEIIEIAEEEFIDTLNATSDIMNNEQYTAFLNSKHGTEPEVDPEVVALLKQLQESQGPGDSLVMGSISM